MKRLFVSVVSCALAVLSLVLLLPFGVMADNAPSQHVTISVTPSEMTEAGVATVSITIRNDNAASVNPTTAEPSESPAPVIPESAYTNITISNEYGVSFPTAGAVIPAGSSQTFSGTLEVTTSMIGATLTFTVSWVTNGSTVTEVVTTRVLLADTAYLAVTRTATPATAAPGTVVSFTYTFTNTGSKKLNEIKLIDRYVYGSSSRPMLDPFSLDPGQEYVFEYSLTMGSSTIVSNPIVTFIADGSETELTVTVPSLTIGLINVQVTKDVVRGESTPEGVLFTLYITNNGNQKLTGLNVQDELGNSFVDSTFSLAVGETRVIECMIPNPISVRHVVFKITGYDNQGTRFTDNTESFEVRPYIDTSLLSLSFTPALVSPINSEGYVGMEFTIHNTGSLSYYDLSLYESQVNAPIQRLDEIAPGEVKVLACDVLAGVNKNLLFSLGAYDSSGNDYTFVAQVSVTGSTSGELVPDDDPSADNSGVSVVPPDSSDADFNIRLDEIAAAASQSLRRALNVVLIITLVVGVILIGLGIAEFCIRRAKKKS